LIIRNTVTIAIQLLNYEEFEETRAKLINDVKSLITEADKNS